MKKVLICVAHSDDETIGCGGTISYHKSKGHKVFCLSMTDGVGARDDKNNKAIISRKKSAIRASKILGFKWIEKLCGKFPDNKLDKVSLLDVVKIIEKSKKMISPDIIYTHNSSDLNVDHRKVFEAVITAFRPQPKEKWKQILSFEVPSATDFRNLKKTSNFQPNYFVDINKHWKKKLQALKAYKKEMRPTPHSRSLDGIETLAKYRGFQSGMKMAEAFEIIKKIRRKS